MKKKADMLKGLEMPKKKMADEEAAMDLEGLGVDEEMQEPVAEADMEKVQGEEPGEEMPEEVSQFADITDEQLIEEMKKRGLIEDGEFEEPKQEEMPA